jgi:tetratricopeptide (TPR) repeat protein
MHGALTGAVLLCTHPQPGNAQTAAQREALDLFRRQVGEVRDTVHLRRWEREFDRAGPSAEAEAIRRMERGWLRLRLALLGDRWSAGRAAGDFDAVASDFPSWPAAWYGLGEARRREADELAADPLNLGSRIGFGKMERAALAFERALQVEPAYGPAIRGLYDAVVSLRDTVRIAEMALPALRAASNAGSTEPSVYFALGRAERTMGEIAASVSAFRRYLSLGGDPGPGLRDLAWSAYVADDRVADSAYAAGAEFNDSLTVAGYREDIALIASEEELARFDQRQGFDRVTFLDQFWHERDRAALRNVGERIREHFRRMTYAERHYMLEVNRRHYAFDPNTFFQSDMYRSGSTRFDDRGVVYIRQGEPDERVLSVTYGIQPNESWRYRRANGDLMLHFAANVGGDIHDLRLIKSVADIGGVIPSDANNPATLFAFLDRCKMHEPYCKYLNWTALGRAKILRDEREIVLASTQLAVTTDANERKFADGISADARGFAVGTVSGKPLLHLAFAVGLERPAGVNEDSTAFVVPLQVRVNFTDSLGRSAGWIDTTTDVLLPGGGGDRNQLSAVGRVALPMSPGTWYYQMAVSYRDTIGVVLPTQVVTVRPYDGSKLAVSDLVLSRDRRGARWVPVVGDTAWMNPRTTWAPGDVLSLYHELYGITAGTAYRASLVLKRGRQSVLSLGWNGTATGGVTRVTRTLSLERVPAGDYVLELEVIDAAGRKAKSSTSVSLRSD